MWVKSVWSLREWEIRNLERKDKIMRGRRNKNFRGASKMMEWRRENEINQKPNEAGQSGHGPCRAVQVVLSSGHWVT